MPCSIALHIALSLAATSAGPGLTIEHAPPTMAGAWVATLTLADSSRALSGHAVLYLLFSDSTHSYLDAVAIVGEHRSDLRSQFGAQPVCVPMRGPAEAFVDYSRVRVSLAPGAADCGLLLKGEVTTPDSIAGEWILPRYAGDVVAGTFVMVRARLPLLPAPQQPSGPRGFGRDPRSPIRLGGGETEGTSRIQTYIRQLRDYLEPDSIPTFRLVALCCVPPAPFDAPIDVYEVHWKRIAWSTPPDSQVVLVALDTLYFTRFPLPDKPDGYNGMPMSMFLRWLPNGRLELDGRGEPSRP